MKRFERILKEGNGLLEDMEIWVDRETGVHYLFHKSGYAGGLTVLMDEDGKPVVDKRIREK